MAKERDFESLCEHVAALVAGIDAYERRHMEVMARVNGIGRRLDVIERSRVDDVLPEHKGRIE